MTILNVLSLGIRAGSSVMGMKFIIPAYIDPNTGGMLFQILAVLFGVISGALLLFSGKIKGFYYRMRRRTQDEDSENADVPDDQEDND
ncbi:MAG: hypothetical protein ACK2UM_07875 [Anaerolineales bacterium]|jgi:hypothetical protein